MVGHGSLWPVPPSVLLVPLLVLGLPRRRLAGLATPVLFRRLAFEVRLRIVGSLPFFLQSRPARFGSPKLRNPTSGASPLWPAAEQPSKPGYPLTMGLSPIDAAVLVLDHAWDARVTERLSPWAGLPVLGSFFVSPSSSLASDRRYSSTGVLMKPTALFFWQARSDTGIHCPSPNHRLSSRSILLE